MSELEGVAKSFCFACERGAGRGGAALRIWLQPRGFDDASGVVGWMDGLNRVRETNERTNATARERCGEPESEHLSDAVVFFVLLGAVFGLWVRCLLFCCFFFLFLAGSFVGRRPQNSAWFLFYLCSSSVTHLLIKMVREIRVQYRRRHCYRTKSNKVKVTKTPGALQIYFTFLLDVFAACLAGATRRFCVFPLVLAMLLAGSPARQSAGRLCLVVVCRSSTRWLWFGCSSTLTNLHLWFMSLVSAGGRLVAHYHSKKAGAPVCGEPHCRVKLAGIKAVRPKEAQRLKQRERTVSRAYGGVLCMNCTRQKYVHPPYCSIGQPCFGFLHPVLVAVGHSCSSMRIRIRLHLLFPCCSRSSGSSALSSSRSRLSSRRSLLRAPAARKTRSPASKLCALCCNVRL